MLSTSLQANTITPNTTNPTNGQNTNPLQGMLGSSLNPQANTTTPTPNANPLQGMLSGSINPSNNFTTPLATKPNGSFPNNNTQTLEPGLKK